MKLQYLGDSYDIVKQSLLRWLGACGPWQAHPMFTERFSSEDVTIFSCLLGVPLLSVEVLEMETDREAYFSGACRCVGHLFLDPDTGIWLKDSKAKNHPSYLFGSEVISIVSERPTALTLVFDQSLARGQERKQLTEKMAFLKERGIDSLAYVSHACFVLMSTNEALIRKASGAIQGGSGLPAARFIMNAGPHNDAMHPIAQTARSG